MTTRITAILLAACTLASAAGKPAAKAPAPAKNNTLTQKQKDDGWLCLFDGKTLGGWTVKSGTATYKVDKGSVLGTTVKGSPNTFLTTDKAFRDFELTFDVLLVNKELNSGVQIRSKLKEAPHGGRVYGPQVEIEAGPGQAGFIYGEAAGGWQSPEPKSKDPKVKQHDHFKNGEWNQYRIKAVGRKIQTWINGNPVADLTYDEARYADNSEGIIGLQVHGVGNRGPYSVRWKNIYLKEIAPAKGEPIKAEPKTPHTKPPRKKRPKKQ